MEKFKYLIISAILLFWATNQTFAQNKVGTIGSFQDKCLAWYSKTNPNELVEFTSGRSLQSKLTSKYRIINDNCMHYVVAGDPESDKAILLIHGYPQFWYGWHKLIDPLVNQGYFIVMPDVRGVNESGRPKSSKSYLQTNFAKDMATLIKSLGREKMDIIAYDTGGMTGWYIGAYYPQVVRKLMIVNFPHPEIYRRNLIESSRNQRRFKQFSRSFFVYAQSFFPNFAHDFFLKKGLFLPMRIFEKSFRTKNILWDRLAFEMKYGPKTGVIRKNSITDREIDLYTNVLLVGKKVRHSSIKDWFNMFNAWSLKGQVLDTNENKMRMIICSTLERESTIGMWKGQLLGAAATMFREIFPGHPCDNLPNGVQPGNFRIPKINVPVQMVWGKQDAYLDSSLMVNKTDYLSRIKYYQGFEIHVLTDVSHWVPEEAPERLLELSLDFFESRQNKSVENFL